MRWQQDVPEMIFMITFSLLAPFLNAEELLDRRILDAMKLMDTRIEDAPMTHKRFSRGCSTFMSALSLRRQSSRDDLTDCTFLIRSEGTMFLDRVQHTDVTIRVAGDYNGPHCASQSLPKLFWCLM